MGTVIFLPFPEISQPCIDALKDFIFWFKTNEKELEVIGPDKTKFPESSGIADAIWVLSLTNFMVTEEKFTFSPEIFPSAYALELLVSALIQPIKTKKTDKRKIEKNLRIFCF